MSDRFLPIADDDGDDPDLIQDRAAPRVTRVEVLDHRRGAEPFGRAFVAWDIEHVELSYQDGGRTLKIFLDGEVDNTPPPILSDEERAARYAAIRADRSARRDSLGWGTRNSMTKLGRFVLWASCLFGWHVWIADRAARFLSQPFQWQKCAACGKRRIAVAKGVRYEG